MLGRRPRTIRANNDRNDRVRRGEYGDIGRGREFGEVDVVRVSCRPIRRYFGAPERHNITHCHLTAYGCRCRVYVDPTRPDARHVAYVRKPETRRPLGSDETLQCDALSDIRGTITGAVDRGNRERLGRDDGDDSGKRGQASKDHLRRLEMVL